MSGATLYNYFRQYDPRTGRYTQMDPIGLAGGLSRPGYVGGNPLTNIDPMGLANSGQNFKVPDTTNTVRVDPPHVPGQQTHAHVYDKHRNLITAVNIDGTGSHGQCPTDLPKNKKLLSYLLGQSFALGVIGDALFLRDLVNNVGRATDPSNPLFYPDGIPARPLD